MDYDVAIIGGGPGGEAAAQRAYSRGAKVCLIEQNALGGTCLNVGCIPTKAMLHASDLFYHMNRASELGLSAGQSQVDGQAYMKRVTGIVAGLVKALDNRYKSGDVTLIRGRAKLATANTIHVDLNDGGSQELSAGSVIIATGASPVRPKDFPWSSPAVMTTNEATTAATLPESVLIIGGGVIGCEFATIYSELGIPTTLVEMLDRLAAPLDQTAGRLIHRSLRQRKVNVLLRTRMTELREDAGGVKATTDTGQNIEAACALVSVGRRVNTDELGLENAGVTTADGIITVDDHCRTNIPNIYAIGDVAEKKHYAHLAARMGQVAADNATGLATADDRSCVPAGVFTHPEAATVGLSEAEATDKHTGARAAEFQYRATGVAWAYGRTEGTVKIIADEKTGRLYGGVAVGYHATDVLQELALAMKHGLTVADIAETIHPHPTFVEAVALAAQKWIETNKNTR